MAEPVKTDDALARAMREAFQRHMENAADAARSAQREPVRSPRPAPPRPPAPRPQRFQRSLDRAAPGSAALAAHVPAMDADRVQEPALVGDGFVDAPEFRPPPRRAPAAPPALNDLSPTVPGVVTSPGEDLAQRARAAVQEGRRLRPPEPVNDLARLPSSLETARPDAVPAFLESLGPAADAAPAGRVVLPAGVAPTRVLRPARSRRRTALLGTVAGVAVAAALLGSAGLWLLREPATRHLPDLGRLVSVVRGMWATRLEPAPVVPTRVAQPADALARPASPSVTADRAAISDGAAPKADMLIAQRVHTMAVRLDPVALAVQDAQDRLARGDLAAARLILEQYRQSGDPRALFALASTFDPTEQHDPAAQDRPQAEELYEKAAQDGLHQAAERLARLRIGTTK